MVTRTHLAGAVAAAVTLVSAAGLAQQPGRPPAGQPGTVTLSLSDYDRLVARADRLIRPVDPPPIPATIARAEAIVRVIGDRARGTFTLEGEVYSTGITKVPLLKGAPIVDARIGTTPLALLREGDTTVALIEGPRAFTITLEWGTVVTTSPGRAGVNVPVPAAGTVGAVFELPAAASDVQLHSGAVSRTTATPAFTRVEATLVPRSSAFIGWAARKAETQTARSARSIATVYSLVSLREAETRLASMVELSVLAGQPERIDVAVPAGYAFTGASGSASESAEESAGVVSVRLSRPQERRHQFLLSFERQAGAAGAFDVPLPRVIGAERETGEVAIEATGTVELTVNEREPLRRMDVREAGPSLLALTGQGVLAALRYQRRGDSDLTVSGDLTRYPDASLITAVADRAVATTLVTVDGRTLTEITLTLRNRAQPFLRVELPAGASMVSAEVAGETAKLASAADGARVPLLRPGFRPNGPYSVSFVYVQAGTPFLKKGRAELQLPKMDVAIGLVEWELFVPDRYRVRKFDGDALVEPVTPTDHPAAGGTGRGDGGGWGRGPGSGASSEGGDRRAAVGETKESVTVTADVDTAAREPRDEVAQAPSQNVFNLQRRVEGVLPVRVDVPRAGSAYKFVRPLVIDEETRVSFDYRSR